MARPLQALRGPASLLVTGALLLLLHTPLCPSSACPMDAAARALCRQMGRDCCQGQGERATRAGTQVPAPDLLFGAAPSSLAVPREPAGAALREGGSRPLAAPAVLQGVGLFTLFAVFLI